MEVDGDKCTLNESLSPY